MSRQKLTDVDHVEGLQLFASSNKNGEEIVLRYPPKATILRPPPFNKTVTTTRYVTNTSNIPRVRIDTKVPKKYGSGRYPRTRGGRGGIAGEDGKRGDYDGSNFLGEGLSTDPFTDGAVENSVFSPTQRFKGIHPVSPIRSLEEPISHPVVITTEPLKEDIITDKSSSSDGSIQTEEQHETTSSSLSPLSLSADTPLIFPQPSLHRPQYERGREAITAPPSLISLGTPAEPSTRRSAQIINCTETTQTTHNKDGVTWSKRLTTTWKTLDSPQKNTPPRKSRSSPSVPLSSLEKYGGMPSSLSFSYQPVSTTPREDRKKVQGKGRHGPRGEIFEEMWEPIRVPRGKGDKRIVTPVKGSRSTPPSRPTPPSRSTSSPSLSSRSSFSSLGRGRREREEPESITTPIRGAGRGRSPTLPIVNSIYTSHPLYRYMQAPHSAIVETKSYRGEDEVWTNNHVLYFRGPNETTDVELKTAIQDAIKDAGTILGRDMGACITNLVAKHTGETFGYGYIWVSSAEMYNVLLGLNPDGSQRYKGNPNNEPAEDASHEDDEQEDDGWGDYFPLKKDGSVKRIESWADEVEGSERRKGRSSSEENIGPIVIVTVGERHESCKIEQAKVMDVSVEFVHNVICCTKVPTGIREVDIQSAFLPFVSDRSKRVGGRNPGTYPHVAITSRNVAYVTFDPETRNAQFALYPMGRVVIKGCSINFKQCKERRKK